MSDIDRFVEFVGRRKNITVLSGAGCSTASGIPDYRDDDGNWKNAKPVQFSDFVSSGKVRKRYWARSFAGWQRIASAEPNAAHAALADLERSGYVHSLITQNVDNLHRRAGSESVIDLHGVLEKIRCLGCDAISNRSDWQARLAERNPDWDAEVSTFTPDGDAVLTELDDLALSNFNVPDCPRCGGTVKPNVVFFGEPVPSQRVNIATKKLHQSEALLVVGSSLMVFSGYRFARLAHEAGIPVVIINRGRTRADDIATQKLSRDCAQVLPVIVDQLAA
jgi:NAD-dependent SIR2 family protein deacetylase